MTHLVSHRVVADEAPRRAHLRRDDDGVWQRAFVAPTTGPSLTASGWPSRAGHADRDVVRHRDVALC